MLSLFHGLHKSCQGSARRVIVNDPRLSRKIWLQRICEPCAVLLEPLQPFLAGTISKAVQPAVHDVTDPSAMRSWFNAPLSGSLEGDIYKATNIVRAFARTGTNMPERHIPASILQDAAGFAVLSTVKVMLWLGLHKNLPQATEPAVTWNQYSGYAYEASTQGQSQYSAGDSVRC